MSTKPPSGTRDFLPSEVRRRQYVVEVVRRVYERYGFEPLETPAFENIDTLLGKYGEEGNKLIFKILRRGEHERTGEADLALRYDLTVPLARVVAQYQGELPRFFKRYQIQPVWRADRPARGRFREFYQCDIDVVGSSSPMVEAEVMGAVSDVLTTLGFNDFEILLNHRGVLSGLLAKFGMPADALISLDKLDKIGVEGVVDELVHRRGLPRDNVTQFVSALVHVVRDAGKSGPRAEANETMVERLRELAHDSPAVNNLKAILDLTASSAAGERVRVDPSLARGLSYYTGSIMEIAVADLPGSLGGGGRYDNLIGMFLGKEIPAFGFSLGLERIIVVMDERKMFPADVTRGAVDVMITIWNEQTRADSLALATELRRAGLSVDVYPEADKLAKQFKDASSRAVPFVAVVGDDERARGEVSIKDLRTGEQQSRPRADAARFIRSQS